MPSLEAKYEFGRLNFLPSVANEEQEAFLRKGLSTDVFDESHGYRWKFINIEKLVVDGEDRGASESPPATDGGSDELPTLRALRKSDEIENAVIDCLDSLPAQFEQSDVIDALNAQGLTANRSTLSQALIRMAKAELGFGIARPGKGRMATVFANQLAGT